MKKPPPDDDPPATRRPLPRWLVVAVILTAGGVTVAAMSMTGLRGPALAWERANQNIEAAWFGPTPAKAADDTPELPPAANPNSQSALPVAMNVPVPTIVVGATMTHVDRGVCTNCHAVLAQQGAPIPAINSLSVMTHEYRGVCGNCHQMKLALLAGTASPVAAAVPSPIRVPPQAAPRALTEAEWQGLEVGPSPQGVLVAGAEGSAQRAGMQAGDVVTSINAVQVRSVADFARATDNGALAQGTVIVRRNSQRLAFELGAATKAQPVATSWTAAPAMPAAQQQTQF